MVRSTPSNSKHINRIIFQHTFPNLQQKQQQPAAFFGVRASLCILRLLYFVPLTSVIEELSNSVHQTLEG